MRTVSFILLIAAATQLLVSAPARAELTVEGHVFSDVVDRSIRLSNTDAAVGLSASWDWQSGWFVGASGYYAEGTPSGVALNRNLRGYLGWFRELDDGRAIELSVAFSDFPSVDRWNYRELRADYHLSQEAAVTLAYSDDYFDRGASAVFAEGTWKPQLNDSAYLLLSGGLGSFSGTYDSTMIWGEAGLGIALGRFDLAATFSVLDSDTADFLFRDTETLAVRISYLIR